MSKYEYLKERAKQENKSFGIWFLEQSSARFFNGLFGATWALLFAWIPTTVGRYWRRVFLRLVLKECGRNLMVSVGVHLEYPRNIRIGDNVWIGRGAHLEGKGGITIGDHVMIAFQSVLQTAGHEIVPGEIYRFTKRVYGNITIGNNVWLGARSMIRYGVSIGDNSVIGMGGVVVKDIPANTIAVGIPAKPIKDVNDINSAESFLT